MERFTPFVDGVLDPIERSLIEAHLGMCEPCRDRAQAEQTARRVMRSRAAALCERAPGGLLARCADAVARPLAPVADGVPLTRPWTKISLVTPAIMGRWVALSVAATLLLAIVSVFVSGSSDRLDAAFAAQMALDHTRCFEASEATPGALDARQAEARLRDEHGWNIAVPAGTIAAELELQDVRRCAYAQGDMAHIMYRHQGRPLSLFVVPSTQRRARQLEIMRHDAVIWAGDNRTFVLIGQESQPEMTRVAALMQQVAQ